MLLTSSLGIIAGFALLVWSADRFVLGASSLARNLGVSPLVIGLTIVGFGTSAPEMLVSAIAAWQGSPEIAVGNAIGSNIANVGLVIGVTAILSPIDVKSATLRREFPVLFAVIGLTLFMMIDLRLDRLDSVILLGGMIAMVIWIVFLGLRSRIDPLSSEFDHEIPKHKSMTWSVMWLLIGLLLLLASSKIVVWGATSIAQYFGVSDLVIGLTIIAIGTSLPELAASVMCALRNEDDMAIGNVVGSNMFNLLGVMGLPGLIKPFSFHESALTRDYAVMFVFCVALFVMSYGFKRPGRINRLEGGVLLSGFIAYMIVLYFTATGAA